MATAFDTLRTLAVALYGERWQRAVARDLGCNQRQIVRWAAGEYEPKAHHIEQLTAVAEAKARQLLDVARRARHRTMD